MLNKDGCARDLSNVGVDAIALIDHADFVYRNKDELTFSELLSVVLGLRGRNETKVQDLVQLRKFLQVEMQRIEGSVENLHIKLVGESGRPDPTEDVVKPVLFGRPEAPEDVRWGSDQATPPHLPPPELPSCGDLERMSTPPPDGR
ncbi:unnamed protein product [Prorocentrum cordatum]|uniref:Uncharacterized protein n=1 Tax=Prorocentrum cordatum TaxID=2364126 RepID=A0ABN9TR34_9DINO|nr:unnamed protein product [Polarella glacialis]